MLLVGLLALTGCDASGPVGANDTADGGAVDAPGDATASAASSCGRLLPGERLNPGESVWSCNGAYRLYFQTDRNLVLYGPSGAIWATSTVGANPREAVMQGDGNLVIYRTDGVPVWNSRTPGYNNASLRIQDDGNVTLVRGSTLLWQRGEDLGDPGGDLMGTFNFLPAISVECTRYFGYDLSYLYVEGQVCNFDDFQPGTVLGDICSPTIDGFTYGRLTYGGIRCDQPPK